MGAKAKTTARKPIFQKRRIKKLAAFLRRINPEKFDMHIIARTDDSGSMKPFECTSAACAMGWTPAVFPKLVKWDFHKGIDWFNSRSYGTVRYVGPRKPIGSNRRPEDSFAAMEQLLGITDEEAEMLFGDALPRYKFPKQVAKVLEDFAEERFIPEWLLNYRRFCVLDALESCDD